MVSTSSGNIRGKIGIHLCYNMSCRHARAVLCPRAHVCVCVLFVCMLLYKGSFDAYPVKVCVRAPVRILLCKTFSARLWFWRRMLYKCTVINVVESLHIQFHLNIFMLSTDRKVWVFNLFLHWPNFFIETIDMFVLEEISFCNTCDKKKKRSSVLHCIQNAFLY